MRELMKWALVAVLLVVVVVAACDGKCAWVLAVCVLDGCAVGLGHGIVIVIDEIEKPRAAITTEWVIDVLGHSGRAGLVVGLACGVVAALIKLLA